MPSLMEERKSQISMNRELVKQLIDVILYLGRHSLALRGHREKFSDSLRGNYKDLLILLSSHSPIIASYLTKLQTNGKSTLSFISWERQNQMIDAISSHIAKQITIAILKSVVFSISLDTSFDISRKDQLSFVVRYVTETTGCVQERFLAMRSTHSTTGQSLMSVFEDICQINKLLWKENLIGQSYDGASNMRGQYNGLQAFIRDINPHATFVWCWAHRLNLIVTDSVNCCLNAMDLFGTLEKLYDFVSSSKNRVWLFEKFQKQRYPKNQIKRLKRVDTTRWNSQSSALTTVNDTFLAILDTLDSIRQGEGTADRKAGFEAGNLRSYMTTERFIFTTFIFQKLFSSLQPLSKMLQSQDLDLFAAAEMVNRTKNQIIVIRNDESFQEILTQAKEFVNNLENNLDKDNDEDVEFIPLPIIRSRKKKMPGELANDQVESDPLVYFKIETYYKVIDNTYTQIDCRFNELNQDLFKDLSLLTHRRILEIRNKTSDLPVDAFNSFADIYKKFMDKDALISEYCHFVNYYEELLKSNYLPNRIHRSNQLTNNTSNDSDSNSDVVHEEQEPPYNAASMVSLFTLFCKAKLKSVFPNLYMALKIAVSLPVSSTTTERSFSKMKLIKTRLRSTMGSDRLEGLMRMSCEFDIDIRPL